MSLLVNAAAFVISAVTVFFLFLLIVLNTPKFSKSRSNGTISESPSKQVTPDFPLDFPYSSRKGQYADKNRAFATTKKHGFLDFFKIFGRRVTTKLSTAQKISPTHPKAINVTLKVSNTPAMKPAASPPNKSEVFDYFMGFIDVTHTPAGSQTLSAKRNGTTILKSNTTRSNTSTLVPINAKGNITTPKGVNVSLIHPATSKNFEKLEKASNNVTKNRSSSLLHNVTTTVSWRNKTTKGVSRLPDKQANLTTEHENVWNLLLDIFQDSTTEALEKEDNDTINDIEDDLAPNHTIQANEMHDKWRALATERMRYLMDVTGVLYIICALGIVSSLLLIFIPSGMAVIISFFVISSLSGAITLSILNVAADRLPDWFVNQFSPI